MNEFFQVDEEFRMILQSGEYFFQGFSKCLERFHSEQFILLIDSEPVIDRLQVEILLIHFAIQIPAGFIPKTVFTAMFIPERFFEVDVAVRSLALETQLEKFLMPAVITQKIHENFEVHRRFHEFRKFVPETTVSSMINGRFGVHRMDPAAVVGHVGNLLMLEGPAGEG